MDNLYAISGELLESITNYLLTRPSRETYGILKEIESKVQKINIQKTEEQKVKEEV